MSKAKNGRIEKAVKAKRAEMIAEFYRRMFILGGMITATDTYKRTMSAASVDFSLKPASYHLTFRRGLDEPGAGDQLIMAGHEAMLAQWFNQPLKRGDIEIARYWCSTEANVKAFPHELWDDVLARNPRRRNIDLDIDVWGFPGGQTMLKNVPAMSFEGIGGLITLIEPAMCRYFAPVIQATKTRLMSQSSHNFAEFGLRAAVLELNNIILLHAMIVGGGGKPILTSNDTAEFMWPDLFKSIGTLGHELMCSNQRLDKSLSEAEYEMMDLALTRVPDSKLLCDLIDAETIGLRNFIKALLAHPEAIKAGGRIDSGEIAAQCVQYFLAMRKAGITPDRTIVYEDEVNPTKCIEVEDFFVAQTGEEANNLFPGAGGYFWRKVHRDTVSAAFKRSATDGNPNIKFSNSPGKESYPGTIRVYGIGEVMYIADKSEVVDGIPLYVQLVKQGRIVYNESLVEQGKRANETWGKYTRVEVSPLIQHYMDVYRGKREEERLAFLQSEA
ncbi:hypothetical protein BH10CYA1_BH10CYA1_17810 [soil metagenome]